jgi:hypothetical protein
MLEALIGVDVRQVQPVPVSVHSRDHVANAAPGVEALVQHTQLRLGRRHEREADGGAEEAAARILTASISTHSARINANRITLVRSYEYERAHHAGETGRVRVVFSPLFLVQLAFGLREFAARVSLLTATASRREKLRPSDQAP